MPYLSDMTTDTPTYEEIEDAILHLPITDRSRLATRILESLDDDSWMSARNGKRNWTEALPILTVGKPN